MAFYDQWLSDGHHGEMQYLARHRDMKRDPRLLEARARSAIVFALDYVPHPAPVDDGASNELSTLRVAHYARGRDYHDFWLQRLATVARALEAEFSGEVFRCFTDSAPVLERDLALRAGLGWVGKNTCLIDRAHGSLFFIGEIYTSLALEAAQLTREDLERDFCGTCTRCLDACPTDALTAPRTLVAHQCISYLTIESKRAPPLELREKIGDWFFGCDICQTVCPWNLKKYGSAVAHPPESSHGDLVTDLREVLTLSNRALERRFQSTALARAGAFGLRRNAMVVIANQRITELRSEVARFIYDANLGELAQWCLAQLEAAL